MTEPPEHRPAQPGETSAATPGAVRCSDAERAETESALHVAAGKGRLTIAEVEDRIARVYTARYRHELAAITADLPPEPEAVTGWRPIVSAASRQVLTDLSALLGRDGTVSTRRRLTIALITLATVLVAVSFLVLALHGIGGDGFEHHELGRE
ncbi:DUF1707 domain-containing protein [Amycolatopsis balhimycina DSM 5908]|uniref:DUF1707 domain-containing protein n=1 Tax=Amycolatopsis balhimycina DSM 5908 TaxID=1081091 RepID=A0A428WHV4_AMYBA|nr:DUF1707 domain-containing protein [Amycolatopsis balhimycina]RSM42640.1 DUF1707 domain-containing protein [Amycolatopsis balhimycina DSM 5908]